jgi:hypothetical protein
MRINDSRGESPRHAIKRFQRRFQVTSRLAQQQRRCPLRLYRSVFNLSTLKVPELVLG